jgi:hypothetical protein
MSTDCGCGGPAHGACKTAFQYAVKVVCGTVKPADNTPVAPGRYWTSANFHNTDKCHEAHFLIKVGVALQDLNSPVSQYIGPFPLRPDGMLEIDCSLFMLFVQFLLYPSQAMPAFVKGYMVIESDIELDIVAVYTGSAGSTVANTFQTERVPKRCVVVCDDLSEPLYTGIAPWQTIASTSGGALGPAVPVNPRPTGWAPLPPGSQWISQFANDGSNATTAPTTKQFELCFDLCAGFTPVAIPLQVIADDQIQVYLNGTSVGGTTTYNTVANVTVPSNLLRPGHNCFRAVVTSTFPTAIGFALAGMLNIQRGKCPCPVPPPTRTPGAAGVVEQKDPATAHFMAKLGLKEAGA